eukprot:365746-Amphidinium_carterae.1
MQRDNLWTLWAPYSTLPTARITKNQLLLSVTLPSLVTHSGFSGGSSATGERKLSPLPPVAALVEVSSSAHNPLGRVG